MEDKPIPHDFAKFERIASLCMCANLRRASRAVTSLYDEFLHPSGLLTTQFILLSTLAAQESIALTPLADQLGMDPTTLARNLKPLERDHLLQVTTGKDRRMRIVKLTKHGSEVLATAIPLWEQAQAWVLTHVGEDRRRIMLSNWLDLVSLPHP